MAVDTDFTIASGIYLDEQDLLADLDTFMTGTLSGWTQLKIITDTASDKNIAYYNDGLTGEDDGYDRSWTSLRATSNNLEFHHYSLFNTTTDTGSDDLYDASHTYIPTNTSGIYYFIGSRDAVHVCIEHLDTGDRHHGGFGAWISYHDAEWDPKPYYVFGQAATNRDFADGSNERVRTYGAHSWGKGFKTVESGSSRGYISRHQNDIQNAGSQVRSGEPYLFEPVFWYEDSYGLDEVRGEIPGMYLTGGAPFSHAQLVTVSGIGTISGDYFCYKLTDAANVVFFIGSIALP